MPALSVATKATLIGWSAANFVLTVLPFAVTILASSVVMLKPIPPFMHDTTKPARSITLEQTTSISAVKPAAVRSTSKGAKQTSIFAPFFRFSASPSHPSELQLKPLKIVEMLLYIQLAGSASRLLRPAADNFSKRESTTSARSMPEAVTSMLKL